MPFPLMKLAYLAVKQISKPLANLIKLKAKTTPFLRNKLLLPPAQFYHKMDTTIKMKLLGLGKVVNVKPLTEQQAVDLSADMLGEFIIFGVASVILLAEYKRSQYKEMYREAVQNERLRDLEKKVEALKQEMSDRPTLPHLPVSSKIPVSKASTDDKK